MGRFTRVTGIVLLLTALIGNCSCKKSLGWESFERAMNAWQNNLASKFFKSIGQSYLSVWRYFKLENYEKKKFSNIADAKELEVEVWVQGPIYIPQIALGAQENPLMTLDFSGRGDALFVRKASSGQWYLMRLRLGVQFILSDRTEIDNINWPITEE